MRYAVQLTAISQANEETIVGTCERKLREKYDDDLREAMKAFLDYCAGAKVILDVTIESTGRFIVESLKPLEDFLKIIQNVMTTNYHKKAEIICNPL